ncbi:MAG: hypothetical protein IH969_01380 [Candidatus Krumholzibacteriota bacterium]|nr:hypothetical protein [Candidatus Krumholzibacteriota bacterium]
MVEGGSGVFSSFVDSSCWHALYLFQSPVMFGDGGVDLYRGRGVGVTGRLVDQIRMDEDTLHLYVEQGDLEDVYRRVTEQ